MLIYHPTNTSQKAAARHPPTRPVSCQAQEEALESGPLCASSRLVVRAILVFFFGESESPL